MPLARTAGILITAWISIAAGSATAQDVADPQPLVDRVVFAQRDVSDQKQEAERRRVDALGEQAQQQAVLIAQQSVSVRQLAGQVQSLRSERELTQLAQGFDAAIAAGQWLAARTYLADVVALDSIEQPGAVSVSADEFVAGLPAYLAGKRVLPRSNQEAIVDGDTGIVTADGFSWGQPARRASPIDHFPGRYEYRFMRVAGVWKIAGLTYRPSPLAQ